MARHSTDEARRLLFLGTHGHVIALAKETGEVVWSTSLPRTGYDVVAIVYEDGKLFCASGGHAFRLDPETGEIEWENALPGMGFGLVFLTTVESSGVAAAMAVLSSSREQDTPDTSAST